MADLIFTGNKKLKTLNKEFQRSFSYLLLAFFEKKEWDKAHNEEDDVVIEPLSANLRVADIRTTRPEDGDELSINGNTIVENFEDNFLKTFGIYVQVCFRDKDGNGFFTSDELDKLTLSALNRRAGEEGCEEYPAMEPGLDSASVKGDQVTAFCCAVHDKLNTKISALEPVNEKKHYARGKSINLYREYYADIDDPFIEGFYIEFDPEEEEFYIGFTVTPPDSNKREFKKALETACAKQGIDADEYGCFSTYEEFSYQSFLATDIDIMTDAAFQMYAKIKKIRQSLE